MTTDEVRSIVLQRENLRRTVTIALIVGTVLFGINQLDVVLSGQATASTWIKGAITYAVPFVVSNLGVLQGERRVARLSESVDVQPAARSVRPRSGPLTR